MENLNIDDIDEGTSQPEKQPEKQQEKQKVIIFCIPGSTFNSRFVLGWSELLLKCLLNNYRPVLCQENDRNIFIERNKCLGGNILQDNKDQKPFQGSAEYDYIVWINPNNIIIFSTSLKWFLIFIILQNITT